MQSASVLVPLPIACQPEQLPGQGHHMFGNILKLSSMELLTLAFTQSFTPEVMKDLLLGQHSSYHHQYKSCWKVFQHFVASHCITYSICLRICFFTSFPLFFMNGISNHAPLQSVILSSLLQLPVYT